MSEHGVEYDAATEAFDRLSVPDFIRPAMLEVLALAWDLGYDRGVRDEIYDLERADNPYVTPHTGVTA